MTALTQWVTDVNSFLWGTLFLIPLLCGTGLFYTLRLRFVQVRKFGLALRYLMGGASLFGRRADKKGMSSFQALATAIAAQVGTGNVAGTATAMVLGGPGALFWLWLAAFFGMATIFAEAVLAQVYKTTDSEGHVVGGPAWYITRGMGEKYRPLAVFFAIAIIVALGCIGNMVQSNTIAEAFNSALGVDRLVVGVIVAALAGLVFIGGLGRIASVTEKLVPTMAILYIAGGTYVLVSHADAILPAFGLIFEAAFHPQAVLGGAVGISIREAMRYGVARGLFANEAGMGSTPHAHAVARVEHPCQQGLVAIFGVFTTFVIITFTALVILVSGVFVPGAGAATGIRLTQAAYAVDMGGFGGIFVAVCLFFFAFSTIVGWYFFGAQNVRFLFNGKGVGVYRVVAVAFVAGGALLHVDLVWQLADLFNGLMVIPNLVALWALNKVVVSHLAEFEQLLEKSVRE
ncbi:MAG: sodium:alanine symporter family protein [Desulfovibrio sp.]|uniref:alanine/glycine:cation symporter family protein n=1 Tax=Desulfovibrio sp. TaxID=885 RepID=UPI001A6E49E6|nr:sodium:alanine symporter family protein [Desulfovibrio sp.]MBD5416931.1 sodium:alanine symporter family protein [Desulfovibrio sp.]